MGALGSGPGGSWDCRDKGQEGGGSWDWDSSLEVQAQLRPPLLGSRCRWGGAVLGGAVLGRAVLGHTLEGQERKGVGDRHHSEAATWGEVLRDSEGVNLEGRRIET